MRIEELLVQLYKKRFSTLPHEIIPLPRSGSYRKYFRLKGDTTVIGTYNENFEENQAFIYMSKFFKAKGLNVPEIHAQDLDQNIYLQQDLGNTTLLSFIKQNPEKTLYTYKIILNELIKFQTSTDGFDWSKTYPVPEFDQQALMFDLNYFKYMVLKQNKINFHELRLQQDFENLVYFITTAKSDFFVYRDFQSRNIMIHDNTPFFIDYQGGRKGNLFYDLASLLYDSKANLNEQLRNELKEFYYRSTWQLHKYEPKIFDHYFYANVLIRKLQALAAYVFRGLNENKIHFILGIPNTIRDLLHLFEQKSLPFKLPELEQSISQLAERFPKGKRSLNVNITINSFSYNFNGYPEDKHGNNGGFVFDCRALPNPGRLAKYTYMSGIDKPVKDWLEAHEQVEDYMAHVFKLVSLALENYHERGYTHLQVNFGCTGGQHRSVFCAEKLAQMLKEYYDLKSIEVNHLMQGKGWE